MADDDVIPKKKTGKAKWVVLILLILLLAGGGAGGWYYFLSDLPGSKKASEQTGTQSAPAPAAKKPIPQQLQTTVLDNFLVNLADPLGKRYINVTFEVEVTSPGVVDELAAQRPKVRDAIILLLSSKSYADLAPLESKLALKSEIISRLNQILGGPKVTRVFFTHMVVQ